MRGSLTLFSHFIEAEDKPATATGKKTGRSAVLICKRDTRLLHRYYYYVHIARRQYVDTLGELENEFDLSERRLIECLTNKHGELKEIFKAKPDVKALRVRYPFMNWPEVSPALLPSR